MTEHKPSSFLDRTLANLRRGWQSIAGSSYDEDAASTRPNLPDEDAGRILEQMQECLDNKGGEVSARTKAAALGRVYLALDKGGREKFLRLMAGNFGTDAKAVETAIGKFQAADTDAARLDAQLAIKNSLQAPWRRLLTQFNALPDGVKFLVDLRAELLPLAKSDAGLKAMEHDLRDLLASWFDVDFLELRRIAWDTSSASLLEKLIAYEAVHAIKGWEDLKNRLDSDRRCYAFFHPRMPDEPLIFVEVALVHGMAANVQALLDTNAPATDPAAADTAIFYSISNAQKGLAGISFGNFLIKRVAQQLSQEFPNLKTFATLSPIPGFRHWLNELLAEGEPKLFSAEERKALNAATGRKGGAKGSLISVLDTPAWIKDDVMVAALQGPLTRLAARYLAKEKGRGGRARDPVAHFHLSNGARLERLNWLGDTSDKGLAQSAGLMVNYLYDLGRIEGNHEAYTSAGSVDMSSGVKAHLRG
ncbi:malonyl-CoA decarboxylase [Thalassospiraceae bacterium LMO-SO8]|nr:malonyl-CoA decarboxylase [Alphaproteobacteria bacterium LMO-S08]WND75777.1 malonyl-CoA decarboxylase [Thalassospiraceae bacterium LMO-SO8]